jgi:hypothetical protein
MSSAALPGFRAFGGGAFFEFSDLTWGGRPAFTELLPQRDFRCSMRTTTLAPSVDTQT